MNCLASAWALRSCGFGKLAAELVQLSRIFAGLVNGCFPGRTAEISDYLRYFSAARMSNSILDRKPSVYCRDSYTNFRHRFRAVPAPPDSECRYLAPEGLPLAVGGPIVTRATVIYVTWSAL
ncbi:hypothetical protein EVAR_102123_1 [Eumeta japonica]|uniref:Uncharacterized protein n=1 Tax=Eumeta variegata TaxID=151549 RepID=A0A4C1TZT0_EUMVA|nr:hypothetical protein EVAR_102123_1 [Eumeta japonica]